MVAPFEFLIELETVDVRKGSVCHSPKEEAFQKGTSIMEGIKIVQLVTLAFT
jgi:hypothetical protein